jgi:hypothetical protein
MMDGGTNRCVIQTYRWSNYHTCCHFLWHIDKIYALKDITHLKKKKEFNWIFKNDLLSSCCYIHLESFTTGIFNSILPGSLELGIVMAFCTNWEFKNSVLNIHVHFKIHLISIKWWILPSKVLAAVVVYLIRVLAPHADDCKFEYQTSRTMDIKMGSDCSFAKHSAFTIENHMSVGYDLKNGGHVRPLNPHCRKSTQVLSMGQNLQPFTCNGDVSVWVKDSQWNEKLPNN